MKYWKTRFETSGDLALYFEKLGILCVSTLWKGELKLELDAASDCWRRCCVMDVVVWGATNRAVALELCVVGRVCRVQLRMAAPAVEGAGRMTTDGERRVAAIGSERSCESERVVRCSEARRTAGKMYGSQRHQPIERQYFKQLKIR